MPYLIARGDHGNTVEVMAVVCVNWKPVTVWLNEL